MKTHIPYLDGWRGLAIVFLMIGHFFPVPGINFGAIGVALFFVLSGFLMSKILFVDRVPLSIFYRRRIARILPSVVVFLAVVALAYLVTGRAISSYELLAAAFTNNYFLTSGPWTMPVGHIWSLSVEEHAYILLSLLALSCRARQRSGLVELGAAAGLAAATAMLYWFAFGRDRVPGLWLHTEVLMDRSRGLFHKLLELQILRKLGTWSFSLYLWQQPFYMLTHREGLPAPLALAGSLIVGVAAFHMIEHPARTWLNRATAKGSALSAEKSKVPVQP